jgi:hypothetical protein
MHRISFGKSTILAHVTMFMVSGLSIEELRRRRFVPREIDLSEARLSVSERVVGGIGVVDDSCGSADLKMDESLFSRRSLVLLLIVRLLKRDAVVFRLAANRFVRGMS